MAVTVNTTRTLVKNSLQKLRVPHLRKSNYVYVYVVELDNEYSIIVNKCSGSMMVNLIRDLRNHSKNYEMGDFSLIVVYEYKKRQDAIDAKSFLYRRLFDHQLIDDKSDRNMFQIDDGWSTLRKIMTSRILYDKLYAYPMYVIDIMMENFIKLDKKNEKINDAEFANIELKADMAMVEMFFDEIDNGEPIYIDEVHKPNTNTNTGADADTGISKKSSDIAVSIHKSLFDIDSIVYDIIVDGVDSLEEHVVKVYEKTNDIREKLTNSGYYVE